MRIAAAELPVVPRSHDHGVLRSTQEISDDRSAPSDCAAAGTPDDEQRRIDRRGLVCEHL
jgi:hypothetical protein